MIYTTPLAEVLQTPPFSISETDQSNEINAILSAGGISGECIDIVNAPQLTEYHYKLYNVLQISKIKRLLQPIQAVVNANVRMINSDSGHFALEVPKQIPDMVYFKNALLTKTFNDGNQTTALLGENTDSQTLDITASPHTLIAGATGSGKSVLLNTMITSLLFKCTPIGVRFVMIDPKQVELTKYNGIPHLLYPVITDIPTAIKTLNHLCGIMHQRYNTNSLNEYRIVVVIDELADLMLRSKKATENSIAELAYLGRAAGIHLIVATQRPTVNVVTGLIKANMPCRIALKTASSRDSVNILDHKGAESLQGKGDALLKLPSQVDEIRFQSAFINDIDIQRVCNYWRQYNIHKAPSLFKRVIKRK